MTELGKKINRDNLIYKYRGETSDEVFDEYDNALDLINKIKKR